MASPHENKSVTCKAAVLWGPQDMRIETVEVGPPKKGEVRVKVLYNSLCHTDLHFINASIDSPFPAILGHEASGVVESIGEGVTLLKPGDYVVPAFMAQCRNCYNCKRGDNNICQKSQFAFNNFFLPMEDGTSRFTCNGKTVNHFMGTSTFSQYTVIREIHCAKIPKESAMEKVCLIGCGFTTGFGAAQNSGSVRPGDKVAVFGAGCVGLAAIHGASLAGAKEVIALDLNQDKESVSMKMGATKFVNPKDCPADKKFTDWFMEKFGMMDVTIECIGAIPVIEQAFEILAPIWGKCVLVGVSPPGKKFSLEPVKFLEKRSMVGSVYGDYKLLDEVPHIVERANRGEILLDPLITHKFNLEGVNEAIRLLSTGQSIRSVMKLNDQ